MRSRRRPSLHCRLLAGTLAGAMLLAGCKKSPQQAFQDGLDAYAKKDYKTALDNWRPLAEQGDAAAQTNVGLMYSQGRGVQQDYAEALKWYNKAAMQNYPDAEYNVAVVYKEGKGVPPNTQEALRWFRYAAESGHIRAQMRLGQIFLNGDGVEEDSREAIKWLEEAANKGEIEAQVLLADIFAKGRGVPEDHVRAYLWYSAAALQEDDPGLAARAAMGRMRIVNNMDEVELAEGERQVEEWRDIKRTEANQ